MSVRQDTGTWECSCDIEIVFHGIEHHDFIRIAKGLPIEYELQDKKNLGWGSVILRKECWEGDRRNISDLIINFVSPLFTTINRLRSYIDERPLLRIGVYHTTYTITISIKENALRCLAKLDLDMEISAYPSS